MRLTRQADYAVRLILKLVQNSSGRALSTKEIAASQEIPKSFLVKIIQTLSKAGIIKTVRGPAGGIKLVRRPSDLTLLSIVEAIEGPICLNVCIEGQGRCGRRGDCSVSPVWNRVQEVLVHELESVTFSDLAKCQA